MTNRKVASDEAARASLHGIQAGLETYFTSKKFYPVSIKVLIKEGFLAQDCNLDPWKREFRYQPEYTNADNETGGETSAVPVSYRLACIGYDGKPGTSDDIPAPLDMERHRFGDTAPRL